MGKTRRGTGNRAKGRGGLTLSGCVGASFWVGETNLEIVRVVGGKVTIRFCGPKEIPIDRDLIRQRKLAEAAKTNS